MTEQGLATVETDQTPGNTLAVQLRNVKPYLEELLPHPERFASTVMTLARRNPDILRCDPASVVGAALTCAQMDLEPGPAEHVWLIPRWNKKTQTNDCTLMLGYKGMKALTERHPSITSVRTGTVYEGDEFDYVSQPPSLRHVRRFKADAKPYLWYAIAYRRDADAPHIVVLDEAAVEERRRHSQSPELGPWKTHRNQMAEKSAIRALWKELPSSMDLAQAMSVDDGPGVITPQQVVPRLALTAGNELVDRETGEIIEAPLRGDGAGAQPSAPEHSGSEEGERPGTVRGDESSVVDVTSEPEHLFPPEQSPEQASSSGADVAAHDAPATARPTSATDDQIDMLDRILSEFTPMYAPHLAERLQAHRDGALIGFDEATAAIEHGAVKLEEWRRNRRERLASAARAKNIDLPKLLADRDLPFAGELDARTAQSLIDEIERIEQLPANQPSDGEVASAPAADSTPRQSPEIRAQFDAALQTLFAGPSARARWRDKHLISLGLKSIDEMTDEQLHAAIVKMRKETL